jgi:hypothetical protein
MQTQQSYHFTRQDKHLMEYSDQPCAHCGGLAVILDGVPYCAALPCCGWAGCHEPTAQERHLVGYLAPEELTRLQIENAYLVEPPEKPEPRVKEPKVWKRERAEIPPGVPTMEVRCKSIGCEATITVRAEGSGKSALYCDDCVYKKKHARNARRPSRAKGR